MQNRVLLTLGAVSRFLHLWKRQHNIHLFTACTHIPRIIKMQRLYIHLKICLWGPSWWLSGKESACQCRRHRFDPWSRKSPHVSEQLSPCASTIELVLWSLGAITTELTCLSYWKLCTLELVLCSKRSHHNEKPLHHNENATREKPTRQRRPDTAENKYTNFKNYIWKPLCGY